MTAEQRAQLLVVVLHEWQTTKLSSLLTEAKDDSSDESEREVFHQVALRLRKIQGLLDPQYHSPCFLRGQLQLMTNDIPRIRDSFMLKVADTPDDAENRISQFLSTTDSVVVDKNPDTSSTSSRTRCSTSGPTGRGSSIRKP